MKTNNLIASLEASTARLEGATPAERERTAAIATEHLQASGDDTADGASGCDEQGVPQGLPIQRQGLPTFSEILSPATCDRLRNARLGGALVFAPSNF